MSDILGALKDPEFRRGVRQGILDAANRGIAAAFGAPVDIATMVARPFGYSTPDRQVVGSSEWLGKQMEDLGMVSTARNPVAEMLASVIMPAGVTTQGKRLYELEQAAARNLAAPRTLNTPGYVGQRGAVGFVYPQQEALDIAQRNAAKPVSEGGLGLPPNNTAMDRAKAMGFDTDAYHATGADINYFIPHPYRGAVSVAATPDSAMRGALAGVADNTSVGATNIMPLMMRSEGVQGLRLPQNQVDFMKKLPEQANESQVNELMKNAPKGSNWFNYFDEIQKPDNTFVYVKKTEPKVSFADVQKTKRGADGSNLPDWGNEKWSSQQQKQMGGKGWLQADEAGISASIVDPTILRSRFAAFDPARINENNLLGYADPRLLGLLGLGTAGGIGAYNYMQGK